MDPNICTYRFVNASLYVYISITIKEQNEVVVAHDLQMVDVLNILESGQVNRLESVLLPQRTCRSNA